MTRTRLTGRLAPFASMFLIVGLSSCVKRFTDPVDQVEQTFQDALLSLNNNSNDWQATVQGLNTKLDGLQGQVDETIRNDVATLAGRSTAKVFTNAGCTIDNYARHAKSSVSTILSRYQKLKKNNCYELPGGIPGVVSGGKVTISSRPECQIDREILPPLVCAEEPGQIDLGANDPKSWSTVTLHGFDMDIKDKNSKLLEVVMVDAAERTYAISENNIARNTHYMATVNLSQLGRELVEKSICKLRIRWGSDNATIGEVAVLPWKPRTKDEAVALGSTEFTPPRSGGDADFDTDDDDPTRVNLRATLRLDQGRGIYGRVYMKAYELKPDHTAVEGWSPEALLYQIPQGYRIVSFSPNQESSREFLVTDHNNADVATESSTVANFHHWVDRNGDEAGSYTRVRADWHRLTVKLEELRPTWLQ
ncbi:MAG TPA: hypothetical protein PKO15_08375 [Fibrobacteria bacterium]|nr:hypothetical protein [Fibrobacteria bacterium]